MKKWFALLTLGNDYRCYYFLEQMLFVLRPSPEHCKGKEGKKVGSITNRQTDCNTTGGST